jgi:hypothetical protein
VGAEEHRDLPEATATEVKFYSSVATAYEAEPAPPPPPPPSKAQTVMAVGGPGMCLVPRGDQHELRFREYSGLKSGRPVLASFAGVHQGQGLGREYLEEKTYNEWRYTESRLGEASRAVKIVLEGGFIKLMVSLETWNRLGTMKVQQNPSLDRPTF